MTDYSKMSDFEINKLVGIKLGVIPIKTICFISYKEGDDIWPDYCNNPADAWPVMWRNNISLIYIGESFWAATNEAKKYIKGGANVSAIGVMPLRVAMIVFLMMKDAEKC